MKVLTYVHTGSIYIHQIYSMVCIRPPTQDVHHGEDAAAAFGAVRLASKGRKNDMMDKLIAAHALALKLTLVTNKVADFRADAGFQIENWLE